MTRQHGQGQPVGPVPHNGGMGTSAHEWWSDHLWLVDSFEVTTDHLALLRRANIDWNGTEEQGSLGLSAKRPFGNSDPREGKPFRSPGRWLCASTRARLMPGSRG